MAAGDRLQIRIESILGGHSAYQNFSSSDQFQSSYNIDPDLPAQDQADAGLADRSFTASGYIRPAPVTSASIANSHLTSYPMWIVNQPKNPGFSYIYGANGSVHTFDGSFIASLGDLNDGGTAVGNGAEYYDNYVYFARDTTVARYGPLNGTPAFTDDYWVATLSKTTLNSGADAGNGRFPSHPSPGPDPLPNHVMLRHKDGALYFADVVGNQGVLHKIKTTKTTVEGDTDDGSTYNCIDFPYGMYITALESYGELIAVALVEMTAGVAGTSTKRARLALWDPTNPQTYELLTADEYPDPCIFALLNSNGVLYLFSGDTLSLNTGVRVSRYIGGSSWEQIAYLEYAYPPYPGGVDGKMNKIVFGTQTTEPIQGGAVFAIGSTKSPVSNTVFNIMGVSTSTAATTGLSENTIITSLKYAYQSGMYITGPLVGFADVNSGDQTYGINFSTDSVWRCDSVWRSQVYKIGQPFKVTKIRIPLATPISTSSTITPSLYMDDKRTQYTLENIDSSTYGSDPGNIVIRPENAVGKYNFFLSLDWIPSADLLTVALPITIEYELLDD